MKALWTIISMLALANFLALIGFIGWLQATGRMNADRVQSVRALFSPTIAEEEAMKAEAAKAASEAAAEAARIRKMSIPPAPAEDLIREQQDQAEVRLQSKQRLDSELKALQQFLVRESERLQEWEQELRQQQAAWEAERKKIRETDGSDQFKKAMATLAGVKPKEAQSILAELLAQNKHDEVVSYIDAMDERARSKVLAEFNKVDPRVAADLLERLRTRGIASALPVGTGELMQ